MSNIGDYYKRKQQEAEALDDLRIALDNVLSNHPEVLGLSGPRFRRTVEQALDAARYVGD